jgi:hypothetical protein
MVGLNIISKERFALEVENIVHENSVSYIDAILMYCEENDVELERAGKLINKKIKSSLEREASDLNMLKTKVEQLEF